MQSSLSNFNAWTQDRALHCYGTNANSTELPFQGWRHFKEAFAPELIKRAVEQSSIPVRRCLDPFGGSGTTALASQFLGIYPITVEVNPFLADLIEAKLSSYDANELARDLGRILRFRAVDDQSFFKWVHKLPPTFVQPGVNGRWLFDELVARKVLALLQRIDSLNSTVNSRFFRVLLAGTLTEVSNVRISGKGRRYRSNWQERSCNPDAVASLFRDKAQKAIVEVHQFAARPQRRYDLIRGDCRKSFGSKKNFDLVVFSPPYPNSFDYTDVYNLELWMLGYLQDSSSNRLLRNATLSSHVQVKRSFAPAPGESPLLIKTVASLHKSADQLWSKHIPDMVGGYFNDLFSLLSALYNPLSVNGSIWMCVGDSQYSGIRIPTARILCELADSIGYRIRLKEPFRSMRSSPQQGGKAELPETLLMIEKVF
jgi:DNA modification methylase